MKRFFNLAMMAVVAILVACGAKEPEPSSFATIEEQRAQGRSNAGIVAAEYQRQNPRLLGWESIVKADTSHTSKCPQGDGWAEVVFMRTERDEGSTKNLKVEKATVMCSTVSVNEGCVMVAPVDNWTKHPKKTMDGVCGDGKNDVPMPLPRVVGAKG